MIKEYGSKRTLRDRKLPGTPLLSRFLMCIGYSSKHQKLQGRTKKTPLNRSPSAEISRKRWMCSGKKDSAVPSTNDLILFYTLPKNNINQTNQQKNFTTSAPTILRLQSFLQKPTGIPLPGALTPHLKFDMMLASYFSGSKVSPVSKRGVENNGLFV